MRSRGPGRGPYQIIQRALRHKLARSRDRDGLVVQCGHEIAVAKDYPTVENMSWTDGTRSSSSCQIDVIDDVAGWVLGALLLWGPTPHTSSRPAASLRCQNARDPVLSVRDAKAIVRGVRRWSRFPVVRVEATLLDDHGPDGALEAITLTWGECNAGGGYRYWVRKEGRTWRVLKRIGHWAAAP